MLIFRKENLEVAIIDPTKKIGEDGQYVRYDGNFPGLEDILSEARVSGHEIRNYIDGLNDIDGEILAVKHIITEIPPLHIQPFHHHDEVDEINMVISGEVYFTESDNLDESDIDRIRENGVLLRPGDVVLSTPGKRHTISNFSDSYAKVIGTILSCGRVPEFKPDWKR